jgi:hypothetical protein
MASEVYYTIAHPLLSYNVYRYTQNVLENKMKTTKDPQREKEATAAENKAMKTSTSEGNKKEEGSEKATA